MLFSLSCGEADISRNNKANVVSLISKYNSARSHEVVSSLLLDLLLDGLAQMLVDVKIRRSIEVSRQPNLTRLVICGRKGRREI